MGSRPTTEEKLI